MGYDPLRRRAPLGAWERDWTGGGLGPGWSSMDGNIALLTSVRETVLYVDQGGEGLDREGAPAYPLWTGHH